MVRSVAAGIGIVRIGATRADIIKVSLLEGLGAWSLLRTSHDRASGSSERGQMRVREMGLSRHRVEHVPLAAIGFEKQMQGERLVARSADDDLLPRA